MFNSAEGLHLWCFILFVSYLQLLLLFYDVGWLFDNSFPYIIIYRVVCCFVCCCVCYCCYCVVELRDIMCSTGLSLDPCYTLKGVRGMLGEMNSNPTRFKGTRILYIHTGQCVTVVVLTLITLYLT